MEVTIKLTLLFSQFTGHFLTCISGETDDRQDSELRIIKETLVVTYPISRYRSRLFIKVLNNQTHWLTHIWESEYQIDDDMVSLWIFWIKKEKGNKSDTVCHTLLLWLRCVTWQIWRVAMETLRGNNGRLEKTTLGSQLEYFNYFIFKCEMVNICIINYAGLSFVDCVRSYFPRWVEKYSQ